jgi:hypothetical protein
MSDMTLKADQERQGWTQPSDIAWAMGYVIVTILLVLLWANVPAWGPRVHRASVRRRAMHEPAYALMKPLTEVCPLGAALTLHSHPRT